MTDTIQVFGTTYTDVTGIKAEDGNGNTLTFVRPQGTKSISENGTGIDVSAYAAVDVAVSGGQPTLQTKTKSYAPTTSQQTETVTADSGYDGLQEVDITVAAMPAGSVTAPSSISGRGASVSSIVNALTLTKTVSVTPSVTTPGYVSAGTAGNVSVSLTAAVLGKDATTYHPDPADRAIASATYLRGAQTIKGVRTTNLTADNIKKGVTVEVGDSDFPDIVDSVTGTYEGGGGGGVTNVVEGTFTTGSTSGASTLTIPYTGSGYPIGLMVWPEGGAYNPDVSPWYDSVTRYAVGFYSMTKAVMASTPTYAYGDNNRGCVVAVYKNSTSTATNYSRTSSMTVNAYGNAAASASTSAINTFRFLSATSLSYYVIGSSGYGLHQGQAYHYVVIYSE